MAAAHQGLVHDVVVEQRGQVGQLDRDRRLDDPRILRVAELRRQYKGWSISVEADSSSSKTFLARKIAS